MNGTASTQEQPVPRLRAVAWPADSNRSGNPYNHLLASALRDLGVVVDEFSPGRLLRHRYDIVHVHWPEWALDARTQAARRSAAFLAAIAAARRRGARLVWTMHNLGGHERSGGLISQLAWRAFVGRVDAVISLTHEGLGAARARLPAIERLPAFVVPHGHYRGAYPDTTTRDAARDALGVPRSSRVAVFFGHVRPYKGVAALVDTFRRLDAPDVVLVVAGRPLDDRLRREVVSAAAGDPRVRLHLEFVGGDEVQQFLRSADLVVLPYLETLNSGAALLALSFDRPVLAPAEGAFGELAEQTGHQWVRTYRGPLDPLALDDALSAAASLHGATAPLDAFDWPEIARRTLDVYRDVATR